MTESDELYIDSRYKKRKKIKFPFFRGIERASRVHFQRKRSMKDKVWQAVRVHTPQMKGKGWEVPVILMIMENSRAFRDHRVQGFTKSFKEYWPLEILCSKGIFHVPMNLRNTTYPTPFCKYIGYNNILTILRSPVVYTHTHARMHTHIRMNKLLILFTRKSSKLLSIGNVFLVTPVNTSLKLRTQFGNLVAAEKQVAAAPMDIHIYPTPTCHHVQDGESPLPHFFRLKE